MDLARFATIDGNHLAHDLDRPGTALKDVAGANNGLPEQAQVTAGRRAGAHSLKVRKLDFLL